MKLMNKFTIVTLSAFLFFNQAEANQGVAQCLHTDGKLTISGVVKTIRGTEFFDWKIDNFQISSMLGNHSGSSITNLLEQSTHQNKFTASIATASAAGEVIIDIKGADLSPLSTQTNFQFQCKIISY